MAWWILKYTRDGGKKLPACSKIVRFRNTEFAFDCHVRPIGAENFTYDMLFYNVFSEYRKRGLWKH